MLLRFLLRSQELSDEKDEERRLKEPVEEGAVVTEWRIVLLALMSVAASELEAKARDLRPLCRGAGVRVGVGRFPGLQVTADTRERGLRLRLTGRFREGGFVVTVDAGAAGSIRGASSSSSITSVAVPERSSWLSSSSSSSSTNVWS